MFHLFGIDALSVLIFGPALGAFVVAAIASFGTSKQFGRWLALILSLLFALLSIKVFADYQAAGLAIGDEQYIVAQDVAWFDALGARWTLGIDGISAVMILLTGILTPLAILASWNIEDRSNMHLALLLFFETGSMGVFAAMDLMVFFLFLRVDAGADVFPHQSVGQPAQSRRQIQRPLLRLHQVHDLFLRRHARHAAGDAADRLVGRHL